MKRCWNILRGAHSAPGEVLFCFREDEIDIILDLEHKTKGVMINFAFMFDPGRAYIPSAPSPYPGAWHIGGRVEDSSRLIVNIRHKKRLFVHLRTAFLSNLARVFWLWAIWNIILYPGWAGHARRRRGYGAHSWVCLGVGISTRLSHFKAIFQGHWLGAFKEMFKLIWKIFPLCSTQN